MECEGEGVGGHMGVQNKHNMSKGGKNMIEYIIKQLGRYGTLWVLIK